MDGLEEPGGTPTAPNASNFTWQRPSKHLRLRPVRYGAVEQSKVKWKRSAVSEKHPNDPRYAEIEDYTYGPVGSYCVKDRAG